MRRQARTGFSLIELLVCIAIICILMAMYLPVLSKAHRKAKDIAVAEGLRQEEIGRMADDANIANPRRNTAPSRIECRVAFRQLVPDGSGEGTIFATEILYAVKDEKEFTAYYHTLLNPRNNEPLEFEDTRHLVARDPDGNEYTLVPLDEWKEEPLPKAWEFFSRNPDDGGSDSLGTNVLYTDGHVEYLPYPTAYPACATVATLSHYYVVATQ